MDGWWSFIMDGGGYLAWHCCTDAGACIPSLRTCQCCQMYDHCQHREVEWMWLVPETAFVVTRSGPANIILPGPSRCTT